MARFVVIMFLGWSLSQTASAESAGGHGLPEGKQKTRSGELTNQSRQVEAINAAIANRSKVFVEAWDKSVAKGELQVAVKDVQTRIRKRILDATNGSIDPKELDALVSRIEEALKTALRDGAASSYFDDYYAKLKVAGFFDLSDQNLPPDLASIVEYFQKEYGQDVRSARLVLVHGLPLGQIGVHLGRAVDGASAELDLTIAKSLNLSAPVESSALTPVVEDVYSAIFGSKDVLLVNADMFKKLRSDSLNIIVHELRHMLDHNSNDASKAHFFQNKAKLQQELLVKTEALIHTEKAAIKDAPETAQYLDAVAAKLKQQGANENDVSAYLPKALRELQDRGAKSVVSQFVYRSNEYERRGYLEQARFAKVAQGWTRDRYLQSLSLDIPRVIAAADSMTPNTVLNPMTPSEAAYLMEFFDSNAKVQVKK